MIVGVHPYFKRPHPAHIEAHAAKGLVPWEPPALLKAYSWPAGLAGGGVIGIGELGGQAYGYGGWVMKDIEAFCAKHGYPVPLIVDVTTDGVTVNSYDPTQPASGEVTLDVELALAGYSEATGKAAIILVFWGQDPTAVTRFATKDGRAGVLSWSWGAAESVWGRLAAMDMQAAAMDAVIAGMQVIAAAGDNDADDNTGMLEVDCPACCPSVLAIGGTRKMFAHLDPAEEIVWNENPGNSAGEGTGGGVSQFFPVPTWQIGIPHYPGRMVADVSINADPYTGWIIHLNGKDEPVGGTSCGAPVWAGLIAACATKPGLVMERFYRTQTAFRLITQGDNGAFRAGDSPRAPCGLGSPIGTRVAAVLGAK